jgi:hypothetical protein
VQRGSSALLCQSSLPCHLMLGCVLEGFTILESANQATDGISSITSKLVSNGVLRTAAKQTSCWLLGKRTDVQLLYPPPQFSPGACKQCCERLSHAGFDAVLRFDATSSAPYSACSCIKHASCCCQHRASPASQGFRASAAAGSSLTLWSRAGCA